jgi:hypothetical protein
VRSAPGVRFSLYVFARYISSLKEQRVAASKVLSGPQAKPAGDKAEFVEKVRRALYLGKIVSYAQGFSQLRAASDENNWCLNTSAARSSPMVISRMTLLSVPEMLLMFFVTHPLANDQRHDARIVI